MSETCKQCGNVLAHPETICRRCGTLSRMARLEALLDQWQIPERIDGLKSRLSSVDVKRLHILLSVLAGLLVALPLSVNLLGEQGTEPALASLILHLLGQLIAAILLAYLPIGYLLKGEWPLFSRIEQHLGGPSSLLRVLVYALTFQLFLLVALSPPPGAGELAQWIGSWLLGALFWFFPVGFFLTGALPFAGPLQWILGENLSVRRRLILSIALTLPWWVSIQDIRQLLAVFALNFFLMGHATNWRLIDKMGFATELPELRDRVTMVKETVRQRVGDLGLASLYISELDVTKTDLFAAGQASVGDGYQVSFTLDRARVTLFVNDFGRDLFARTVVHCDVSGRRLWLMFGYVISFLDSITVRWFGSSYLKYASLLRATLTPASRLRDRSYEPDPIGAYFANLFGLLEILPDRDVNDLLALHGAILHTLSDALEEAIRSKGLDDKIELKLHQQLEAEGRMLGFHQPALSGKLA